MTEETSVETGDALLELGFQPDPTVISDGYPGLSFNFGNLTLRACSCLNLRYVEVVLCSGVLSTPGALGEIFFELPRRVKSRKQCAAWIVWNLDQASDGRQFQPGRFISWIEEGRQNQTLLPWVINSGAYNSRPSCTVQRDWMQLAINTLREHLSCLPDNVPVVFYFDGSVLSIRCEGQIIALAGQGLPWAVRFSTKAGEFRRLPRRFKREHVELSIWESKLTIDVWRYDGTIDSCSSTSLGAIQ